jgi:DNA polymerase-3 subunit gamma/tau
VKFIFATTDPHRLPATVQSRCQRYDFRRIGLRQVVARLRQIAESDGLAISEGALFALAREGEGSMRDAQSLLDQVLAGAEGPITEQQVFDTLGLADRATIGRVAEAVIARDAAGVLPPLDDAYQRGCDVRRFTRDLLEHFRDLAVAKVSQRALLPEIADEEVAMLRTQAERISAADCDRAFRILIATDDEVARSPYPKLVLEMALLKLTILPPLLPVDALLERLDALEAQLRGGGGRRGDSTPRESARPVAPAPAGVGESAHGTPEPAAPSVASHAWQGFLAFANEQRPVLGDHLARCTLVQLEGAAAVIAAARGFRFDYLSRREHLTQVEDLATRYFGRPIRVQVQATEAANGGGSEVGKRDAAERTSAALENPAVKAAVQILGGEVAEVRQRSARRREGE